MASTGGQPVKRSFTTTNYIVGTSIYWSKPISLILHQIPRDNVPQNMPKRRTPTILVSVHYMYVCMYVCVTVFTRAGLIICTYRISALVCRTISPSCLCELCCPIICPIGFRFFFFFFPAHSFFFLSPFLLFLSFASFSF